MSTNDETDLLRNDSNPLTEAILEAAEDLEQGRPLSAAGDPLAAVPAPAAPLETLPVGPSEPEPEPEPEPLAEVEEEKAPGFFARLAEASPYTVILWVAFLAILVAMTLLALELSEYGWKVNPKS